jgi:hypothetical protein
VRLHHHQQQQHQQQQQQQLLAPGRIQQARVLHNCCLASGRGDPAPLPWSGLQSVAQALLNAAHRFQSAAVHVTDSAAFRTDPLPPFSGLQAPVTVVPKAGSKRGANFLQLHYRTATMLQSYFGVVINVCMLFGWHTFWAA